MIYTLILKTNINIDLIISNEINFIKKNKNPKKYLNNIS
uniref:Uncharacterized protein n=1 Tax=Polysiphonia sp. TaxID=1967842 RepID=A0A1Z1MT23_9FLOR|nr:hypothetical protein [Polysiphonia sp.]